VNGASADPSPSDQDTNPYTQYDADGVPISDTRPQTQQLTPEEISAIRKQQQKAEQDKDWLLRNYERQLQSHDAANSGRVQNSNLYYQLSTNRELAKLAGLPDINLDEQDGAVPVPHSTTGLAKLRPTPTPGTESLTPYHADLLKPLITPLSAPEAAGLQNFSSLLPIAMPSPLAGDPAPSASTPKPDESTDPADIETPGMIAAEKDPLADASTPDLSLDILPGETPEQAKERESNNTKLELPLPMDANQLHKEQAAKLSVQGLPTTTQTTTAATTPVKAVPIVDPEAPIPVSKTQQINPVRTPVANPFDILNR
jgi:hypothetical protein